MSNSNYSKHPCRNCHRTFYGHRDKSFCSDACKAKWSHLKARRGDREPSLTPGQVDAMLDRAVWMETQPPWVRHPQVWD